MCKSIQRFSSESMNGSIVLSIVALALSIMIAVVIFIVNSDLQSRIDEQSAQVEELSSTNGALQDSINSLQRSMRILENRAYLVAEYTFEGGLQDTSGNQHYGVPRGNFTFACYEMGLEMVFDGNTAVASIPNTPALNYGDDESFTVSLWLRSEQSGGGDSGFGWLVDHRRNNDGVYAGYTIGDDSGKIVARIRDSAGNDVAVSSDNNINDGNYHHVVFVVDRFQNFEMLYIDTTLQDRAQLDTVGNIDTNFDLNLGGTISPNTEINFFDGSLDQVQIYSRALTESQIQDLYDARAEASTDDCP